MIVALPGLYSYLCLVQTYMESHKLLRFHKRSISSSQKILGAIFFFFFFFFLSNKKEINLPQETKAMKVPLL